MLLNGVDLAKHVTEVGGDANIYSQRQFRTA